MKFQIPHLFYLAEVTNLTPVLVQVVLVTFIVLTTVLRGGAR